MEKGSKILLIHLLHTLAMFYSIVVMFIFFQCFGLEEISNYSIMFRNGGYTLLSYFYFMPVIVFLFFTFPLGTFSSMPYVCLFWLIQKRKPELGFAKGLTLTLICLLLILVHPIVNCMLSCGEGIDLTIWSSLKSVIFFVSIVASVYLMPYLLIRLSYPQLALLGIYRKYRLYLLAQLIVYLLIFIYSATSLSDALSEVVNKKYQYWYGL